MKHYIISTVIIVTMYALSFTSCTSDPDVVNLPASIETGDFITTSRTTATVTGKLTANGTQVENYGIVYADDPNILVASKYVPVEETIDGATKQFTVSISGLTAGHTYFYRTFMHSGYDYYYGDYRMFTTPSMSAPTFDEFSISESSVEANQIALLAHIADLGVEDNSGVALSNPSFKYKAVASGTDAAGIKFSDTDASWNTIPANYDSRTRQLSTTLTGLTSSTTYALCAYSTTAGYATSNIVTVTTTATASPEVSGVEIEKLETSGLNIRLHASVVNAGTSPVTERGFVYSTSSPTPVYEGSLVVKADETFTCTLPQLPNSTTYYIRAYAKNDNGIGYGAVSEYTTPDVVILPSVYTVTVTDVKSDRATLVGLMDSNGRAIREMGFSINGKRYSQQVADGSFSYVVTGLQPLTTYSFSTYCITSEGVEFTGAEQRFTTKAAPVEDDVKYPSVQ